MESKKINQLATELTPALSDLTIIGDPTTGISKKITLSQMASLFTGTVEEYASVSAFPLVGVADTIYIALDTNVLYRWDTTLTSYVELSPNIINSLVFNDANGFDGTISLVGSVATLTITTALTQGSVGFIGASGALVQDNANFFWDDTNNRLGIGTNAPTTAIDVFGSGIIGRLNGTSTNNSFLGFASAGTNQWSIGNVQSDQRFRIYSEANTAELVSVLQTGEFGIGIANPTTKLHIDGGASALIANLDANVSVAKSISFRSDNSNRINLEVSGTESGSNAGANLFIRTYSDAGALLHTPLSIVRSNGFATFSKQVTVEGTLIASNANANIKLSGGVEDGFLGVGVSDSKLYLTDFTTGTKGLILNLPSGAALFNGGVSSAPATTGTTTNSIVAFKPNDGSNAIIMGAYPSAPNANWIQSQSTTALGTTFPLTLQPNGNNVGIGINNPLAILHAYLGTITSGNAPASSGTTPVNAMLNLTNNRGAGIYFGGKYSDDYAQWIQVSDKGNLGVNYPLLLNPNGGNVGINNTSPAYALDLVKVGYGFQHYANSTNSLRTYCGSSYQIIETTNSGVANQFGYIGGDFYVTTSGFEKLYIKSDGDFLVGTTTNTGFTSAHRIKGPSNTENAEIISIDGGVEYSGFFRSISGAGYNGAASAIQIGRNTSTLRSINAGGTVNASGADYAEYMLKAIEDNIAKGDIVGVNAEGKLTNIFDDSISFVVKSTDPSYVGGDTWGNSDAIGEQPRIQEGQTDEEYEQLKAEYEIKLEEARAKVDRIAFSGQVPCNVLNAKVGDYIIPINNNGKISGQAVTNPTFEQYQISVGKVWKIMEDGRAWIAVKIG